MSDITCAKCGMVFKAGRAYGFACSRGNDCGLYSVMINPMLRQDARLPPPIGYISREEHAARIREAEARGMEWAADMYDARDLGLSAAGVSAIVHFNAAALRGKGE